MDVNEELKFWQGIHRRMALVVNCFFVVVFLKLYFFASLLMYVT